MNKGLLKELLTLPFVKRAPQPEYEVLWQKPWHNNPQPYAYQGKEVLITRSQRIDSIIDAIPLGGAQTILEVGSGRGDIIGEMAKRYPDRQFMALELTETGVKNHPALPNLTVIRGDMRAMPFTDKQFDLAFSHLAVEQLPSKHHYMHAFEEIRRVSKRAFLMEEFKEYQSFFQRLYLHRRNLFCAPLKSLEEAGWNIINVSLLPYQKYRYTTVCAEVK